MKIALTGPVTRPITLSSKGGVEKWMLMFAVECERRGHQIDLYAIKGSFESKNVNLVEVFPKPLYDLFSDTKYLPNDIRINAHNETELFATLYCDILQKLKRKEKEYDLLIDSTFNYVFTINTKHLNIPSIIVSHIPVNYNLEFLINQFGVGHNNKFVFLNQLEIQKANFIKDEFKRVIPNGVDISKFKFNQHGGNKLTWLGRVDALIANKGLEQAMITANRLQIPLKSYGFVEIGSISYYESIIKKLINDNTQFVRTNLEDEVDYNDIFGNAKAFLFPLQWEEPFGLVQAESMACGTPVIAFARGSVPEVIQDGKTGFIVNPSADDIRGNWIIKTTGIEGICEAVQKLFSLPKLDYEDMRRNCRKCVEVNFSIKTMVDHYLELYSNMKKELLSNV